MTALPLSSMRGDPTAATRALLALAQQEWERERVEADRKRRAAVEAALTAGLSTVEVGKAMGLSHVRIGQIVRDTPEN